MNRVLTTIPAYFDGTQVRLDVEVKLKPNTRLLVTILDEKVSHEALVWSAMKASEAAFARVWDNEEDAVYDLQQVEPLPARTKRRQHLAAAAKALLPDYAAGGELTVFTALDSNAIH